MKINDFFKRKTEEFNSYPESVRKYIGGTVMVSFAMVGAMLFADEMYWLDGVILLMSVAVLCFPMMVFAYLGRSWARWFCLIGAGASIVYLITKGFSCSFGGWLVISSQVYCAWFASSREVSRWCKERCIPVRRFSYFEISYIAVVIIGFGRFICRMFGR